MVAIAADGTRMPLFCAGGAMGAMGAMGERVDQQRLEGAAPLTEIAAHLGEPLLDAADEGRRAAHLGVAERVGPARAGQLLPGGELGGVALAHAAHGVVDDAALELLVLEEPEHFVDEEGRRRDGHGIEEEEEPVADRVHGAP